MAWFNFLKAEGLFNPEKNPEPIQVKDGFQIPHWEVLGYLVKLSIQISKGNETELIGELLEVIKNVSEHPKDNNRTWYFFINILSNIPNERIPIDILNFIPVWMSGKFDTMVQTSELCEKLLPKFLNDAPTIEDIKKAELILHYLFQVEKLEVNDRIWRGTGEGYRSKLYLYFLTHSFTEKALVPKIVRYCSSDFIFELGRTIKFLLLDYPDGINSLLKDGEGEYEIKINIEKENLIIRSRLKGDEITNATKTLINWEDKNETELKQELISILTEYGINYFPKQNDDDIFQRLYYALNTDLTSVFGFNSIKKLNDGYNNREKVFNVFALIFRDLLVEKAKQNPEETILLLRTFCNDKKYGIPFYKRVALYVICENWNTIKSLFWELIKDNDALYLFSSYKYHKELYDLLSKNQLLISEEEKYILQNIINQGEQKKELEQDEKHKEYWQLRWYAALKDIEPFKEKYDSLSQLLNITNEHYENLGEFRSRLGSVSPVSIDDLLKKSNVSIAEYIKTFIPKTGWDDPTAEGLSNIFGTAVKKEPEKFAEEIEVYLDIPYIYSYRMLFSFAEAWKEKRKFNFENVLKYCLETLKSKEFNEGKLKVENDRLKATPDWVEGFIAYLLTVGMENDENAFGIDLLPIAKEIVILLVNKIERVDDINVTNMDYLSYSLNSSAGKSLRALLDYSLYRARNLFKYEEKEKWEPEIKILFEETINNGVIDSYVLEGMYFEQFYFLDKDWITEEVEKHYHADEREWLAFIGGFSFSNPLFNKDIYTLFYPHYDKIIVNKINLKSVHENGLIKHLTAFYFWKYETLSSESLLLKFITNSTSDEIGELINFIWRQENYQKSLTEIEQKDFQQMILELWNYIAAKYENSLTEEGQKILSMLSNWIVFAPELNDTYTKLILKSCKYSFKTHSIHELFENIVSIKSKGNPIIAAKAISEILLSTKFNEYIHGFEQDNIKDLVSFLYLHNQKQAADKFCNKISVEHQQYFLREIYEANIISASLF